MRRDSALELDGWGEDQRAHQAGISRFPAACAAMVIGLIPICLSVDSVVEFFDCPRLLSMGARATGLGSSPVISLRHGTWPTQARNRANALRLTYRG